jgi:aromatic ring-opening dioxygenase LigB subunit
MLSRNKDRRPGGSSSTHAQLEGDAVHPQLTFIGITPHPPIMVPPVGQSHLPRVERSVLAMREFSRRLLDSAPQTLVIISPHSPIDWRAFSTRPDEELTGSFAHFGAPQVRFAFKNDLPLIEAIEAEAAQNRLPFVTHGRRHALDHGALVPLYFFAEAGWQGPIVVLGFSGLPFDDHLEFGRCLTRAARPGRVLVRGLPV